MLRAVSEVETAAATRCDFFKVQLRVVSGAAVGRTNNSRENVNKIEKASFPDQYAGVSPRLALDTANRMARHARDVR